MADLLPTCGYFLLLLYLIQRSGFYRAPGLGKRTIGALFLLKVAAGTVLWGVYTFHYTDRMNADIYKFFDDGNIMYGALYSHPVDFLRMITGIGTEAPHISTQYYEVMNNWYRQYDTGYYNDAHTMIRFNALLRIFSFGIFHVHTVFFAFLALTGQVAMYKAFLQWVPELPKAWMAGLFLWPSVLLWSSGPIKEALLFFGWGIFLLQVFRRMQGPLPWTGWAWMALGLLVQFTLKSYVLACMLPGLLALWWCRRTGGRRAGPKFLALYAAAIAAALVLPLLFPGLDVVAIIQQKQRDMLGVVQAVSPGSYVPTDRMAPGAMGLLKAMPHALYLTFLSPLVSWDIGALGLMGALENAALLALVPVAWLWRRPWGRVDRPMFFFCTSFCLALGLLIGWTTPVVGALMRYRIPLLPFYTLALLLVADPDKVRRHLPFLRR